MAIIINTVRLLISEILRSLNDGYFGRYVWEPSGNVNKVLRRQIGFKLAEVDILDHTGHNELRSSCLFLQNFAGETRRQR